MTVISKKLFYEKVSRDISCKAIHFWKPNCTSSVLHVLRETIYGVSGFYAPIYLLQTALHYKRINKNYFKKLLKSYLRSVSYGMVYATFFMSSLCAFAKIFGRLHYYAIGFGPGFCSALSIFIESKEMLNLNALIYTTLVVEVVLRSSSLWSKTLPQETALFMVSSALVMYLMAKRKSETFTHFWFYPPQKTNYPEHICSHEESCSRYCLNGASRYFLIGYVINLVKVTIGNLRSSSLHWKKLMEIFLDKNNILFASFFGVYVGIFRFVTCLLLKKHKKKKNWHNIVAGFLSGISYIIKPNLQMICIALVTIFQLLLQNYFTDDAVETYRLREILFILSAGILTHTLIMNKDLCPKYFVNVLNTCTGGIILKAYYRVVDTIIGR